MTDTPTTVCPLCQGDGWCEDDQCPRRYTCPHCDGAGCIPLDCRGCDNTGIIEDEGYCYCEWGEHAEERDARRRSHTPEEARHFARTGDWL